MKFTSRLLFLIATLLLMRTANAQQQRVEGIVIDENNNPLAGVVVGEQHSHTKTLTDADGRFAIAASKGTILVFTYLGKTQRHVVEDFSTLKIVINRHVTLGEIVVLGSRAGARSRLESPVPVDVFDMKDLTERVPEGSLSRMLNAVVPSFSSVTHSAMNLTDHVDPATLRGMSPDQTLVLLNGKRLHSSALINVTGGTAMGSVGTDLNTIPSFALQKIEVLRDGASAQYGSDAIAGVIDLQMKNSTDGLTGQVSYGGHLTPEADNFHGNWDGSQVQVDLNYGTKLGRHNGFLNVTGSFQYHGRTARSMDKEGQLYNVYNAIYERARQDGVDLDKQYGNINYLQGTDQAQFVDLIKHYADQVNYLNAGLQDQIQNAGSLSQLQGLLKGDVTDQELSYRDLARRDFSMEVGQPELHLAQFFFNTEIPVNDKWAIYGFGGFNFRTAKAAGYYRYPYNGTSVQSLFPNGYLPFTRSNVYDFTTTEGIRGKLGAWKLDFSNTIGENDINITGVNTTNASLRFNSPSSMKTGGFSFLQNTANLDFRRSLDILSGFDLAFGAEYRFENYKLKAGQPETYENYDLQGNPVTDATPDSDRATDFFGNILGGGSQGFGGFNPSNMVNKNRYSFAGYGEAQVNFTDWLLADGAVRYEHYSDFGSTVNFKLASLIKLTRNLNFRFAASTGFRAPSMAQIYYNTRSGLLTNGVSKSVGLFGNDSKIAALLGIPKLKDERSRSLSAGLTYQIPSLNLSFTADAFITKVNDQIILTGLFDAPSGPNLTPAQQELQDIFNENNVATAEFFANAIDVRTKGFDFIISHKYRSSEKFSMTNNFGLNLNQVKRVGPIHASQILEEAGLVGNYFDELAKTYLEKSSPRVKFNLMDEFSFGKLTIFLQNSFYGNVWGADNKNYLDPSLPFEHTIHSGRVLTDLSLGYRFTDHLSFTIGSANIFDVHQTKNYPQLAFDNQFPYDVRVSQFPLDGRYVFARINFSVR